MHEPARVGWAIRCTMTANIDERAGADHSSRAGLVLLMTMCVREKGPARGEVQPERVRPVRDKSSEASRRSSLRDPWELEFQARSIGAEGPP